MLIRIADRSASVALKKPYARLGFLFTVSMGIPLTIALVIQLTISIPFRFRRHHSPHPSLILPEDRGEDSTAIRIFRGQLTNAV